MTVPGCWLLAAAAVSGCVMFGVTLDNDLLRQMKGSQKKQQTTLPQHRTTISLCLCPRKQSSLIVQSRICLVQLAYCLRVANIRIVRIKNKKFNKNHVRRPSSRPLLN